MPLIPLAPAARAARSRGEGLAAFNVVHVENAEAFASAAARAGSPVVLQISQNAARYHGGLAPIGLATLEIARAAEADVVVHLDHADDLDLVREALDLGVSSIMYDGSKLPDEENRARTAEVVRAAHDLGVSVEAELGEVGGKDGVHSPTARTDPAEAARFVADTGVDLLAVAVGTSHAMTERTALLDLALIEEIASAVEVPLVLHGSSGVADADIQAAIRAGMTKINVSTHLNTVFTGAVRELLETNPDVVDTRTWMRAGREAGAEEAARLMTLFRDAKAGVPA
ncbi:class II fructose-bisphosphate aldolase [Brachybacterium alimentarium]|uniref:class II fructose-bisphosphate aldolase n=1 Tax=Brachybacterium alimentarium TaxID=47845 RepID=UPI000BB96280|nr:class II fructose-bisphosphate aldolase [Brachybacterium alimentarium]PCC32339.1 fructose-bisphosphate aldolase [Brachybacterium alimentarium]RCS66710.1 class II fructose-bisphosphate aldolase [Brachybacterium alimentarium]RCS79752.1 class II fructose-bisphosphate aldolase [Brachybacterium alimentarium]